MASLRAGTKSPAPIEKFKPTNGFIIGYAGLALCVVAVVYAAAAVHSVAGLRVGLGFALGGLVAWVALLRPRAAVYPGLLRLQNSLVDIEVPLELIDDVTVRQTLNVWVGERRYVCVGIGRSRRKMVKSRRPGVTALLGMERLHSYAREMERPAPDQSGMLYETYVVTRIEELVEEARKAPQGQSPQEPVVSTASDSAGADAARRVRRMPAWPEVIAFVVLGAAFVIALLV